MRYIVVKNWPRFQHYHQQEVPVWIKSYVGLLDDDDWIKLSWSDRGVLLGLWLAYARKKKKLPEHTTTLSRVLGQRVTKAQLERLNRAGFITFSSSESLESSTQEAMSEAEAYRTAEAETDTDRENSRNGRAKRTGYRWVRGTHGGSYVCDVNGTDELPRGVQPPVATKRVGKKDDPEPLTVPMPAENREQLKKMLGASQ